MSTTTDQVVSSAHKHTQRMVQVGAAYRAADKVALLPSMPTSPSSEASSSAWPCLTCTRAGTRDGGSNATLMVTAREDGVWGGHFAHNCSLPESNTVAPVVRPPAPDAADDTTSMHERTHTHTSKWTGEAQPSNLSPAPIHDTANIADVHILDHRHGTAT